MCHRPLLVGAGGQYVVVMLVICAFKGWSREYLEQTRERKAAARGGFAARIVLDEAIGADLLR